MENPEILKIKPEEELEETDEVAEDEKPKISPGDLELAREKTKKMNELMEQAGVEENEEELEQVEILKKEIEDIMEGKEEKEINYEEFECLKTIEGQCLGMINSVFETKDGKIVSSSKGRGGSIKILDPETGECLQTLKGHHNGTVSAFETKDGKIVSGSDDIKIWDPETGECLKTLKGYNSDNKSSFKTKNGKFITGWKDGTITIWDPETRKYLKTLRGHDDFVGAVFETKDGRIISGSDDLSIKIWGIKENEEN